MQILEAAAQASFSLAPTAPALAGEWRRVELKINSNADTVLNVVCNPVLPV
jgi:hypothetical protein